MTLSFYNINEIQAATLELTITIPDVYFTFSYGKACELSDDAIWECCIFKDLIYVYLKRPIVYENIIYYDLITPYGYSGYYYRLEETLNTFIEIFRKDVYHKNYITEVVRQNPYLSISLENQYDHIITRTIFGIRTNCYESYFNNVINRKRRYLIIIIIIIIIIRNILKKAISCNLSFKLQKINETNYYNDFLRLYEFTMTKVKARKYYYFNKEYFNQILNIPNTYLALVFNDNNTVIGSSIVFVYNEFVHYHLSCNDLSMNCITDFLLLNIVKELAINKTFILGGGVSEGDSLSKFKESFSNVSFKYQISKNIINGDIYEKLSQGTADNKPFPRHR